MRRWLLGLAGVLGCALGAGAAEPFPRAKGDRVVLLGNTLIEREQRHGYWELALTRSEPGRKVLFRNLGWSGDTVWGHARAGFGSTADGFRHLKEHVLALEPTVILLGYGSNESFDGPEGLPRFKEGCKALLAALAPTGARIIWLAPLRQEKMPPPLPDPAEQNKNLALYRDAIAEIARENKQGFVDLFTLVDRKDGPPLTDNGIHLTAYGYQVAARALEQGLGLEPVTWRVTLRASGEPPELHGATVQQTNLKHTWKITEDMLPLPGEKRILKVEGLPAGKHILSIDNETVATADAAEWARGVALTRGPEFAQTEQLRQAILAKNLLYFHRWRPLNETYVFGFRKKEQGQNAVEIPQFDPLVEKQEEEIARLSKPRMHTYTIKPGADR
jgi:lysophospholipase L1-like esterase